MVQPSDTSEGRPLEPRQAALARAILLAAAVTSVLNGLLIVADRPWRYHAVASLAIAVGTLLVVWRSSVASDRRLLVEVLILLAAQFGILVFTLPTTEPLSALRLLRVAVVLSCVATILSALLAYTRVLGPVKALVLVCSFAAIVFVAETASELLPGAAAGVPRRPEWSNLMVPHPDFGMSYRPNSVVSTYYSDNPRGYFRKRDFRDKIWQLQIAGGSKAELVFPPGDRTAVRVAITQAPPGPGWHIQLSRPHLPVAALFSYTVDFRARADRPRVVSVGFAQAHAPWRPLGLYRNEELTTEWKSFHEGFMVSIADSNGRIQFDLGGNDIPIEVSDVALHGSLDNDVIEPPLGPDRYFVGYQFNAVGCRDTDYAVPRRPGATRILALGDGSTMGTDVHQDDTFAKQIERQNSLPGKAGSSTAGGRYEVINCGVSGYGTHEERLFYQLVGPQYQPDIVLLVMGLNDDRFFRDATEREYFSHAGRLGKLFSLWTRIQLHRLDRRLLDYSKCVAEIRDLDRDVRRQGARLMVAFFRSSSDPHWTQFAGTVTAGLKGTDIPVIDLGRALADAHPDRDLLTYGSGTHPNEVAHRIVAQQLRTFLHDLAPVAAHSGAGY